VLATFALSSDVPNANTIFNVVFFVVVVSAIVQGTTVEWLARRLGLVEPARPTQGVPVDVGPLGRFELIDFAVATDHAIAGASVRELGLPRSAVIAAVARGETSRTSSRAGAAVCD